MKIENIHGFEIDTDRPYLTFRALYHDEFVIEVLPEHVRCNDDGLRHVAKSTIKKWEAVIKRTAADPISKEEVSYEVSDGENYYLWVGTPRGSGGYWYSKLTQIKESTWTMDEKRMMQEIGLNVLTGEADKTNSGRMLCDIATPLASELAEFLGLPAVETHVGWNNPEHRSVMLPHELIMPFVIWCARRKGYWAITVPSPGFTYYTFTKDTDKIDKYKEGSLRCYIQSPIGEQTRNVHQMSGRVV